MTDNQTGSVPGEYREFIESDRVSSRTRSALLARLASHAGPAVLGPPRTATLRALIARLVPQDGKPIDLAAAVLATLAEGAGDGWRVASLPPDLEAYRSGLDTLDDAARQAGVAGFGELAEAAQDALLRSMAAGTPLPGEPGPLGPEQLKAWFGDVCSDAVRAYVAHPRTIARMGYSGIGYGGDGPRLQGFSALGIGEREPWEPEPAAGAHR